mgnify:CR=1 FL=1
MTVFISGALLNPLNQRGWAWYKQRAWAKTWRRKTRLLLGDAVNRLPPLERVPLTDGSRAKRIEFHAQVWSLFDYDNLVAALKPVVDGLVDARLLASDDAIALPAAAVEYRQEVNRTRRGVEVVVEVLG